MANEKANQATIDDLANRIASLDADQQGQLLNVVAELNFRKGLEALSERYQERLEHEGRLALTSEQILNELRQFRERTAEDDYRL